MTELRFDFSGRSAIVTGGSRGIGRAVVHALAAAGARVAVFDRVAPEDPVPGDGLFAEVDVADRMAVDAATSEAIARFGAVDILINNAGIVRDAQLVKMDASALEEVLAVNVGGVFHCTQAVVPHMIERGYGRIISASSIVGLYGNFGQTNYAAAKAGVIGMTRVWAREFGKHGITANAVAPGFIETEMAMSVPDEVLRGMLQRTPVRRLGAPDECAACYLFLASRQASFVNGVVLSVDGGLVLGT